MKLPTCDREPLGCQFDEPPTNSTKPARTVDEAAGTGTNRHFRNLNRGLLIQP
jgi:hypothetical protein